MNVLRLINQITDKYMTEETLRVGEGLSLKGGRLIVASDDAGLINTLEQSAVKCYYIPKLLWSIFGVTTKLKDIVRGEGIDVIESMDEISAIQGFLVSRRTGKDFITNFSTQRITWINRVVSWGKCVIVPTKEAGRQMMETFHVPHHRIRFIPLGMKFIDSGTPQYQILGMDRSISVLLNPLNIEENNPNIVRIISKVSKFIPDIKVTILLTSKKSEKKHRDFLLHMIKRYDARMIRLVQPYGLHAAELYESGILLLNDCVSVTNLRFLIEAGYRGITVIARKERGALDIINDGENGILVSWGDERTLVNALLKVLRDRGFAASLSKSMKTYITREYDNNKNISLRLNLYEEVISTQKILATQEEDDIKKIITLCPYLRTVKEVFPLSHVAVLGKAKYRHLLKSQGGVDEVITQKMYRDRGLVKRLYSLTRMLQKDYYDIGINTKEDLFNRIFLRLVCANRIYRKKEIPMSQNALFRLEISDSHKNYITEFLFSEWVGVKQGIMGLNIGVGKQKIKKWGLENFVKVSDEAARRFSLRTVLTGTIEDTIEATEFIRLSRTRPINAVGKTNLMELAALINRCHVYVTTDTLPLYIACAVDTPTIAISGPTDPRAALPSLNNLAVVKKAMRCSPCNRRKCSDPACIYTITAEDVLECIKKLNICSTNVITDPQPVIARDRLHRAIS